MRRLRAGTAAGILGLVLMSAGWWLSTADATKPPARTAAVRIAPAPARGSAPTPTLTTNGLNSSLRRRLARLVAQGPFVPGRRRPAARLTLRDVQPRSHGRVCPVAAGGFCSLTPCVQFAAAGTTLPSAAASSGPVVLLRSGTVIAHKMKPPLQPRGSTCQGRAGPAQALRVSGA